MQSEVKDNVIVGTCPWCGCDDIAKGFQVQQGSMMKNRIGIVGCPIEHLICKNCGSIVQSRVTDVNMFRK